MPLHKVWLHLAALAGYAVVAVVCSWPLPLHLDSHLTGELSGDTGVYVWNQWVFRHELVAHGSLPLYTSTIFSATGLADLSLHNYTIFADLLAFPLIPWLGVVTTFNVVFLSLSVLTAWTTFVLVRHVTAHTAASWVAGALFAWSPILVARSTAHFSLVAAAPLPVFIWCLLRMAETGRARFAVGAGATTAWAVTCDVYYGVYCAVIAVVFLATQLLRLRLVVRDAGNRVRAVTERVLDGVVLAIVMLASFVGVTGGAEWTLGSARISIHTLYTPMLVCTVLLAAKLLMHSRVRVVLCEQLPRVPWLFTTAVATCVILLSPVLVALGVRAVEGRMASTPIFWRSSPPGVDLLALILPNPNHPLVGTPVRAWLTTLPNAYVENAVSLPLTALVLIGVMWWRGLLGRKSRLWVWLAVCFGSLAVGPFVHVAGYNTYIVTPWTFLRFVPVLSAARTPTRFAIVLMLAITVLFGIALARMSRAAGGRSRLVVAGVALVLFIELLPVPRTLYATRIPRIYDIIAADPDESAAVLEVPFGVRDGTSGIGNFSARAQFYQTRHGKRLVGGYLSRVSPSRVAATRDIPILEGLMLADAGVLAKGWQRRKYITSGRQLVHAVGIRYVVVDRRLASVAAEQLAIDAFALEHIAEGDGRALYRTCPASAQWPCGTAAHQPGRRKP